MESHLERRRSHCLSQGWFIADHCLRNRTLLRCSLGLNQLLGVCIFQWGKGWFSWNLGWWFYQWNWSGCSGCSCKCFRLSRINIGQCTFSWINWLRYWSRCLVHVWDWTIRNWFRTQHSWFVSGWLVRFFTDQFWEMNRGLNWLASIGL